MNRKGQFSIIAALLVAVILVGSAIATYSAIRYNTAQEQPQILSAVDETNLALKEILGFTVGYYGSVLKVTGNMTYAHQLASKYLQSGLNNMDDIRPEWGASFTVTSLDLKTKWFTNESYSQGTVSVNYNLNGLGISGISYNTSIRLDVSISDSNSSNQAQLKITKDDGEPLVNLGKSNLLFYRYLYGNLTWDLTEATNITSYADGTYVMNVPSGVLGGSYGIQVQDNRGLMVVASSFSQFSTVLNWNSSAVSQGVDYVDTANSDVWGTHSNFAAQQSAPDSVYDTLNEAVAGTFTTNNVPISYNPSGTVSYVAGSFSDMQTDNGVYMQMRSYPTAYSSAYNTIEFDSQNSQTSSSGTSMSWTHTTGAGNDKILLVSIDVFRSSGTPATVTDITYDGLALTQIATALYSSNPQVRSYLYYLLNPAVGTKTISVTFSGSTYAVGGSVTYANVNQTTPILSSTTNTGSGTSQATNAISASGSASKVLFGHMGAYRTSQSYTISDSQTTRWAETGELYKGIGSDKAVTSGSVSLTWGTGTRTVSWVAIAALLQPTQVATSYGFTAEFSGSSDFTNLQSLTWTLNAASNATGIGVTYQLYNYALGQYVTSGDGYLTDTLGTSDTTQTQTVATPSDFRDGSGNWKIKVTAVTQPNQYELKFDVLRYSTVQTNYALNLEEQWLSVNASLPRQDLCIKTGSFSGEPLVVQVLHGGSWYNLMTLLPNFFNNASLTPYIDSSTLTIRFVGNNDLTDPTPDTFNVDSVYIQPEKDISFLVNYQQDSTFTIELLQNGTMRWLGQNLQVTSETLPVPPIPVKAIHVNETINGVNQEVPFQIEDWASDYQIPLGLTSNATVFSNRQMIVFLLNCSVTDFTVWWDGNDNAIQTAMAYTNHYFNDNVGGQTLNNGRLTLQFASTGFTLTSSVGSVTSTANLMRINNNEDNTNPELSYVISNGVVRDIVLGEAEYSSGITNCPNTYTNIIIMLPANVKYYTYHLRAMFIDSSRTRTISDLCPIRLSTNVNPSQTQTENGTLAGFPIVQNGTGIFNNLTSGDWTAHHFSQFISGNKGAGIMFTSIINQKLYAFDSFSGSTSSGALKTSTGLIELLPVISGQVQFQFAYDITWQGAVATFDGNTPVCGMYDGTTPYGLWILAEYPPTLTIVAKT